MAEDTVLAQLDRLAAIDPKSLVSGTAPDFRSHRFVFTDAVEAASELLSLPIGDVPLAVLRQLEKPLKSMIKALEEIRAFNTDVKNRSVQRRDELAEEAKRSWDALDRELTPRLSYLRLKAGRVPSAAVGRRFFQLGSSP